MGVWIMRIFGFLRRSRPGDPLRNVATTEKLNRICNILEDIQGQGCHIEKPTAKNGYGWRIVVDGYHSDLDPAEPNEEPDESTTPEGEDGKDIWTRIHDVIDNGGGGEDPADEIADSESAGTTILASTGSSANTDTWDTSLGTNVRFVPCRSAYSSTDHTFTEFRRTVTFTPFGRLKSVSGEVASSVFVAEEETLV